jgi:hypothetical protein
MRFTVAGSRIICSRCDNTVADGDLHRQVVDFDARLKTVPPHVAARLTTGEVKQLEEFMADRKRIRANPAVKNMLEALPGMLQEAADILDAVDSVNKSLYRELAASIARLDDALEEVKPAPRRGPIPVKGKRLSEAQMECAENIKQDL